MSNIFVMTNITEQVDNTEEIENLDLTALQKYIEKDEKYSAIIKAVSGSVTVAQLPKITQLKIGQDYGKD